MTARLNPDRRAQYLSDAFLSVLTMGALVDSIHTVLARMAATRYWTCGRTVPRMRPILSTWPAPRA